MGTSKQYGNEEKIKMLRFAELVVRKGTQGSSPSPEDETEMDRIKSELGLSHEEIMNIAEKLAMGTAA